MSDRERMRNIINLLEDEIEDESPLPDESKASVLIEVKITKNWNTLSMQHQEIEIKKEDMDIDDLNVKNILQIAANASPDTKIKHELFGTDLPYNITIKVNPLRR